MEHILILNRVEVPRLAVSLSPAFYNKQNLSGTKGAFISFTSREVTTEEFVQHVLSGKAWAQGYYRGGRAKENFVSSQTLALDFDDGVSVDSALENPFIRQYAALVHPSPSSTRANPKTRVIFILSEEVDTASAWEAMQSGVIELFAPMNADQSCKDAARMFYGSDVPGAYLNLDARLPIELAGALTCPEAYAEYERRTAIRDVPKLKRQFNGTGKSFRKLITAVEEHLGVSNSKVGSSGFMLEPIACPMKQHEHDDERPAAYWHGAKKFVYCHKCHCTYLISEIANAKGISVAAAVSSTKSKLIECELPYISEYDLNKCLQETSTLLIKSPTGTGKTEAILQPVSTQPDARILVITHRKTLAASLTTRLNQGLDKRGIDYQFENYDGFVAPQLRQIPRLVICVNSLHKLVKAGVRLPAFDLVIMDEVEQQLTHLTGETFSGAEAITTYNILRHIIRRAGHVIAMDAYVDETSYKWLCSLRGEHEVTQLVNTYRQNKGQLHIWSDFSQIIHQANQMLSSSSQPIVLAVSSVKLAKILYSYYSGDMIVNQKDLESINLEEGEAVSTVLENSFFEGCGLGKDKVSVVHGENSQTSDIQALVNNINERLPHLRVLIYTSSMGTGVDIQTPVHAVFGLFSPETITADEMHQMMARCRHAQAYHVCIQSHSRNRETSVKALYEREMHNISDTGKLFNNRSSVSWIIDSNGVSQLSAEQLRYLRLWCNITARINSSLNDLWGEFIKLAFEEFDLIDCRDPHAEDRAIEREISNLRHVHQVIDKQMILNATSLDRDSYNHRRDRGQYTEYDTAGYIRWTIETGYRQEITLAIYDHWEDHGLRKLHTFVDVVSVPANALMRDMSQDSAGFAVPFRSHSAQKRELIHKALRAVWGDFDCIDKLGGITLKELNTRMASYLHENQPELWRVFRWRQAHDHKPKPVLNRLLKEMGLRLEHMRSGEDKGKFCIKAVDLQVMWAYARVYLANDPNR